MDYKVLARKWRPKVFADVVGQSPILQALQYSLKSGRVHHAYLFTGTRGVGKTTIARILAKALSCEQGVCAEPCNNCVNCKAIDEGKYVDVLEIDAASRTKVEDTRELLDNVPYAPVHGRYKVYIIDEVHMLSNHSFNALLKTLEEPPSHVKFLFATTDPHKLPVTILSRCLQFQLSGFGATEILEYLQHMLQLEKTSFELEALRKISVAANGSVRDALTLLEQVISLGQGNITDTIVLQVLGIANYELIIDLLTAVMTGDPKKAFFIIAKLAAEAVDFNKILQELLVMLHKIAVVQVLPGYLDASDLWKDRLLALAQGTDPEYIQLFYQIGINGKKDLAYAPETRLGFEMIILRMIAFQPLHIANDGEYGLAKNTNVQSIRNNSDISVNCNNMQASANKPAILKPAMPAPVAMSTKIVESKQLSNLEQHQAIEQVPKAIAATVLEAGKVNPHNWGEMLGKLKLIGLTKAIAEHCTITLWQQDKIILTLDPVHKALLQPHHEQKIQDALQKYLDCKVQLKINLRQVVDETPALKQKNQQEKIQQDAESLIHNNLQVQEILTTFNAKIEAVIVKN